MTGAATPTVLLSQTVGGLSCAAQAAGTGAEDKKSTQQQMYGVPPVGELGGNGLRQMKRCPGERRSEDDGGGVLGVNTSGYCGDFRYQLPL